MWNKGQNEYMKLTCILHLLSKEKQQIDGIVPSVK